MYKYFIWILCLLSIFIWFFYHEIAFDYQNFKKKYGIDLDIKNDYSHYFYDGDRNPVFIFKNNFLEKYAKRSFENNKSWLVQANQQTFADIQYIKNIQYIASYMETYQAKYMYEEFNNLTSLSPFWTEIYKVWALMMPARKTDSRLNEENKQKSWENVIKLWEKWIFFNCSKEKIKNIINLTDEEYLKLAYAKSWDFYENNVNPCTDSELANGLGFNYFYYMQDLLKTIQSYKIAWFDSNALAGTIGMVSVANGLLWEHEKAIYMMIQKIINLEKQAESAHDKEYYEKEISNSIKRAIEELNFYILQKSWEQNAACKQDYKCLEENGNIENEIKKIKNYCLNKINPHNIKSVEDIIDNDVQNSLENAKCFLLAYSTNLWFIKNNKLSSAMLSWWSYYYDEKLGRRWVRILK